MTGTTPSPLFQWTGIRQQRGHPLRPELQVLLPSGGATTLSVIPRGRVFRRGEFLLAFDIALNAEKYQCAVEPTPNRLDIQTVQIRKKHPIFD